MKSYNPRFWKESPICIWDNLVDLEIATFPSSNSVYYFVLQLFLKCTFAIYPNVSTAQRPTKLVCPFDPVETQVVPVTRVDNANF